MLPKPILQIIEHIKAMEFVLGCVKETNIKQLITNSNRQAMDKPLSS